MQQRRLIAASVSDFRGCLAAGLRSAAGDRLATHGAGRPTGGGHDGATAATPEGVARRGTKRRAAHGADPTLQLALLLRCRIACRGEGKGGKGEDETVFHEASPDCDFSVTYPNDAKIQAHRAMTRAELLSRPWLGRERQEAASPRKAYILPWHPPVPRGNRGRQRSSHSWRYGSARRSRSGGR